MLEPKEILKSTSALCHIIDAEVHVPHKYKIKAFTDKRHCLMYKWILYFSNMVYILYAINKPIDQSDTPLYLRLRGRGINMF